MFLQFGGWKEIFENMYSKTYAQSGKLPLFFGRYVSRYEFVGCVPLCWPAKVIVSECEELREAEASFRCLRNWIKLCSSRNPSLHIHLLSYFSYSIASNHHLYWVLSRRMCLVSRTSVLDQFDHSVSRYKLNTPVHQALQLSPQIYTIYYITPFIILLLDYVTLHTCTPF